MHEYSIVQSLLNLCEDNAKANSATKVNKVIVKIGKLSGVEPHLLEVAFDTFKDSTMCKNSTLEMVIQDIVIECKECNKTSTLSENNFCCPECESYDIEIKDGEDMFLMSLEME
jgi:hydrogenase nickel incorporation protein HypA/HybF